jgi:hypothetical protein
MSSCVAYRPGDIGLLGGNAIVRPHCLDFQK